MMLAFGKWHASLALPARRKTRTFWGVDGRLAQTAVEAFDPGRRRRVVQGVVR
jgi:hypothetical protein